MGKNDANVSEEVGYFPLWEECFDGVNSVEGYPAYDEEEYDDSQVLCGFDLSLLGRSEDPQHGASAGDPAPTSANRHNLTELKLMTSYLITRDIPERTPIITCIVSAITTDYVHNMKGIVTIWDKQTVYTYCWRSEFITRELKLNELIALLSHLYANNEDQLLSLINIMRIK